MKLRKIAAFTLAVVLLAIPMLSLGESAPVSFLDQAYAAGRNVKTTVTFTPGEIFSMNPTMTMIADLLKTLRMETSIQEQGGTTLSQMDLFLKDQPSLSLTLMESPKEFHLLSNLLGDQVLSFTPQEYVEFYIKLMEVMTEGTSSLDAKALNQIRSSFGNPDDLFQRQTSFIDNLGFDPKSLQADLILPLTAWFANIQAEPKVIKGTFESEKHDAAVTKKVHTISAKQLTDAVEIFAAWATKDQNLERLVEMASSSSSKSGQKPYDKEEVRKLFLDLPSEFEKEAANFLPVPATITELLDADGVRKSYEIHAVVTDGSATPYKTDLLAGEYIKTESDGVATSYSLDISTKFEAVSITFTNKDTPASKKGDATLAAQQWQLTGSVKEYGFDKGKFTLAFDSQTSTTATTVQDDWKLSASLIATGTVLSGSLAGTEQSVWDGTDAMAEGTVRLYMMGIDQPACTLAYTTASSEAKALPVIPKDSVRLGKMTAEELAAWGQAAYPVFLGQMMGLMANMPPSILKEFFGNTVK